MGGFRERTGKGEIMWLYYNLKNRRKRKNSIQILIKTQSSAGHEEGTMGGSAGCASVTAQVWIPCTHIKSWAGPCVCLEEQTEPWCVRRQEDLWGFLTDSLVPVSEKPYLGGIKRRVRKYLVVSSCLWTHIRHTHTVKVNECLSK